MFHTLQESKESKLPSNTKLGEGSYGKVYLRNSNVVKEIYKKNYSRENFENEVNILKRLKPICKGHLLCFKESDEDDNNYYIVTDYLKNYTDLFKWIHTTPTLFELYYNPVQQGEKLEVINRIACNLVLGLDQIHSHGIAQLDLKPENILIENNDSGDTKIIDYGGSCIDNGCKINRLRGTEYYASQEMLDLNRFPSGSAPYYLNFNQLRHVDYWALGMTLLYILLGHEVKYKKIRGESVLYTPLKDYTSIDSLLGKYLLDYLSKAAPDLLQLLTGLLQKNPADRHIYAPFLAKCNSYKPHEDLKDMEEGEIRGLENFGDIEDTPEERFHNIGYLPPYSSFQY